MAEKDYADIMFDAVSVLIDKKIESVKFDQTINATIVDATKAAEGVYVVTTGNAKFTAYSTEIEYKENDAVLVMIPQGNYDNQKMIIGKQVDDSNTPLVYKSPFQRLVNITNNLIQGKKEIGYWANDPAATTGLPWSIEQGDFRQSTVYQSNLVLWDSASDQSFIPGQGYTRLGVSAQFSTWLADYNTYLGNYGLAIELTFKSLETEGEDNNSFTKIITFDSKEFFGDVYNFETYYTQENVYDISDYIAYPIIRIRLFAYQRMNFIQSDGERVPYNDPNEFGTVNPNIFIKDPYLCLGIPIEDFNEDMATIMTMDSSTYYKGDLQLDIGQTQTDFYNTRNVANQKIIGLRWVHKDIEKNIIKTMEPDEFSDVYEVRWYRFNLGAKSPDSFAGAHWQRIFGYIHAPIVASNGEWTKLPTPDNSGNYYRTNPEDNFDDGYFTNQLEVYFWPNVNNATEQVKAIVVKNEGDGENPIWRQVAVSNILEFTNETDVRNKASVIDMNALSIQYVTIQDERADCLGTYFLYDRADNILNEGHNEIRFLKLVFDPDEPNVYEKADLTEWTSIKWTIPFGQDTMITPGFPANQDAKKIEQNAGQYCIIEDTNMQDITKNKIAFFIKPKLNRYAGRNTIRAEVVKDGQTYTTEAQMVFGTAGTSGSDYTIQLVWHGDKNAIDVSPGVLTAAEGTPLADRKILEGELTLYDQNGQDVTSSDFQWSLDWKVSERTDSETSEFLQPAYQDVDYYYPVYFDEDKYEYNSDTLQFELIESKWIPFRQGQSEIGYFIKDDLAGNNVDSNNHFNTDYTYYTYDSTLKRFVIADTYQPKPSGPDYYYFDASGTDIQRDGHYYYYTLNEIFGNNIIRGTDGMIVQNITNGNKERIFNLLAKLYIWDISADKFINCIEYYNNNRSNNQGELTAASLSNSSVNGDAIIDYFFDKFTIEKIIDGDVQLYPQQLYYKTHETEAWKKKKQLTFEKINNVYNGSENNISLSLSSQAADDIFFKTNIEEITKANFFKVVWSAIHYGGLEYQENFDQILENFANKYYNFFDTLSNQNIQWKIKVGSASGQSLKEALFAGHSNGKYLRIDLVKKLIEYNNSGLYYNNARFYIINDGVHEVTTDLNIVKELYFLLFNENEVNNDELRVKYFYEMLVELANNEPAKEFILIPSDSEDFYAYEDNGEIVFLAPGYKTTCGILRYLLTSSNVKFYKLITSSNSASLKSALQGNFYDENDLPISGQNWYSILGRMIDYYTKNSTEIEQTVLSTSYLMSFDNGDTRIDLKDYLLDQLHSKPSLQNVLTDLDFSNASFYALSHDANKLNDCLLNGILNTSAIPSTGTDDETQYTPGFVATSQKNNIIAREKKKYYLEEKFLRVNDEEVGALFVLDAIHDSQMRNFTALAGFNLRNASADQIVLSTNPNSANWEDYVNILYQLKFALLQKKSELEDNLRLVGEDNTIEITDIEDLIAGEHINGYTDLEYLYGKLLFRYIKNFLSSTSRNKFVLTSENNMGLLFQLMFTSEFCNNLNSNGWNSTMLTDEQGFFSTYLSSTVARENGTVALDNIHNLNYIGTFTKESPYYTTTYLQTVSEEPNSTLKGINFLDYCASQQSEEYETQGGHVVCVLPEGSTDNDTPTITITLDETNHTITSISYTGVNTIKKKDSDNTIELSNLQDCLQAWLNTQKVSLFATNDTLALKSNRDIYSLYDYRKSGSSGTQYHFQGYVWINSEYTWIDTTVSVNTQEYDRLMQLVNIPGSNLVVTQESGESPFIYTTCKINDANSSLVCTITSEDVDPIVKSYIRYNGESFNSLSYKYLCQRYFPNNSPYPDFISLLMVLIVQLWSSATSIVLANLFGENKIKAVNGQTERFGQSNILIFFPYSSYTDITYFASINKTLQHECITNGAIQQDKIYSKVLQKFSYPYSIMELSNDINNQFYIMLMKMLFIGATNQNVDTYYPTEEKQNELALNILFSSEDIFWQCFSCNFNVDYSIGIPEDDYVNQYNQPQNLYSNFADEANAKYLEVYTVQPSLRRMDQLKTKMYTLLRQYYQKTDFYQFSNETVSIDDLYNYIARLCFKRALDKDLYDKAFSNVRCCKYNDSSYVIKLLKNTYEIEAFQDLNIATPTAQQWVDTMISSMGYPVYSYRLTVGTGNDYKCYMNLKGNLVSVRNVISQAGTFYPIQEFYTYVALSNFYSLDTADEIDKAQTTLNIIRNNNNTILVNGVATALDQAIPTNIRTLLQLSINTLLSSASEDLPLYNLIAAALADGGVAIQSKKWYYKIENRVTKEIHYGLFSSSDSNIFFKEILDIKNNPTKFYNQSEEDDEGLIYFNYYNHPDPNNLVYSKKAFIKRNGMYIVDPYDECSPELAYYYPLQTTRMTNKFALLSIYHDGSNTFTIQPDPEKVPSNSSTATKNSNILLKSLNILQVVLENFGDYKLTAYFPIPLRSGTTYTGSSSSNNLQITYQARFIIGADRVWYPITGQPEYYQNPYSIFAQHLVDEVIENFEETEDITWEPIYYLKPREIDNFLPKIENNLLKPVSIYVKEAKNYGVVCKKNGAIIWSQPIWVYQDRYPSTTVNGWNGKDIIIDNDKGMIVASAFAAGKKDDQNRFSGVMIGDMSRDVASDAITKRTGIYGFYQGETSYAFMEDGTGYIGREGKGRIWFDGDKSQIYSSNWLGDSQHGMLLDIDDGYMKLYGKGVKVIRHTFSSETDTKTKERTYTISSDLDEEANESYITLDSCLSVGKREEHGTPVTDYALAIGTKVVESARELRIGWGGDIYCKGGYLEGGIIDGSFIRGSDMEANYLKMSEGWIGGWLVSSSGTIESPPLQVYPDTPIKSWTELNPFSGITTNKIHIKTKSEIDGTDVSGTIGYITGNDGVKATNAVGLSSGSNVIIQSSGTSAALKSYGDVWLHALHGGRVQMLSSMADDEDSSDTTKVNVQGGKIEIESKSGAGTLTIEGISTTIKGANSLDLDGVIKITGNSLTVSSDSITFEIDAADQHGIYARFA